MIISYNWLKRYLPSLEINSNEEFKFKIDTRLSELESIKSVGEELSNLVIGKITSVEQHPESTKLTLCKVDVGAEEDITIVCGAPNVVEGLYSVVCLPGGQVYTKNKEGQQELLKISKRKVLGIESNGMICAPDELGLSDDHDKIIEIAAEKPGTEVTELFRDVIFEIENKALSHRPDAFSHRGIAREISAIYKIHLTVESPIIPPVSEENDTIEIKLESKNTNAYFGIVLDGVYVSRSPLWMQILLYRVGMRPINSIVDVSNFVMKDIGQPTHPFNREVIEGNKIIVKDAVSGEEFETINQKRTLFNDTLMIADDEKYLGIAGLIGGKDSEIKDDTNRVFIESANFNHANIRKTSKKIGLRTEASSLFEKEIDINLAEEALAHFVKHLKDFNAFEKIIGFSSVGNVKQERVELEFDLMKVKKLSEADITKQQILEYLSSLGFEIIGAEKLPSDLINREDFTAEVKIKIPTWRKDIQIDIDVVEEVLRLYGYEHIVAKLAKRDVSTPVKNKLFDFKNNIKKILSNAGLNEIYTYSMVGAELYEKSLMDYQELIAIKEPISPELGLIRNSLIPSLISKIQVNIDEFDNFGIFESSKVAFKGSDEFAIPKQTELVSGLWLSSESYEDSFRRLKSGLENISRQIGIEIRLSDKTSKEFLHPNAQMSIYANDKKVGIFGLIHPLIGENFKLPKSYVSIFEINIDELFGVAKNKQNKTFIPLTNQQKVVKYTSYWVNPDKSLRSALNSINQENIQYLERVEYKDKFVNEVGRVSYTIKLVIQPEEKSLDIQEINEIIEAVSKIITKDGHTVR